MPEGERVRRRGARDGTRNNSPQEKMQRLVQKAARFDFSQFNPNGEVYIAEAVGSNPPRYKIGKAKNPKQRAATFNKQWPYPPGLVHHFDCEDYDNSERALHEVFRHARVPDRREWFELSHDELQFLKKIVRMRGKDEIEFSGPPGA